MNDGVVPPRSTVHRPVAVIPHQFPVPVLNPQLNCVTGVLVGADVGAATGAAEVGAVVGDVGEAEVGELVVPPAHNVNPLRRTLPSDDHVKLDPACTITPIGLFVPEYAVPLIVTRSKNVSVDHSWTLSMVVCRTLNTHLSLLPWRPGPSVTHRPPFVVKQAPDGDAEVTVKNGVVGADGAGVGRVVGTAVGFNESVP